MFAYAGPIFLDWSFLFPVQPVIVQHDLVRFGGAASVGIVSLATFQSVVLAGCAGADYITRRLTTGWRAVLHSVLPAASLPALPIVPDPWWAPTADENPSWHVAARSAATIGVPRQLDPARYLQHSAIAQVTQHHS